MESKYHLIPLFQEFRGFMCNMGMQFSEEEVDEMMHEIDADGDGEIDYEEFVKMMSGGRAA